MKVRLVRRGYIRAGGRCSMCGRYQTWKTLERGVVHHVGCMRCSWFPMFGYGDVVGGLLCRLSRPRRGAVA